MSSENFDEEGLLKVIQVFELSSNITKLNWNWDNVSDPVREAQQSMLKAQKLLVEISEYEHRCGPKLSNYQKNQIVTAVEDLEKVINYMKTKIKATVNVEDKSENEDLR